VRKYQLICDFNEACTALWEAGLEVVQYTCNSNARYPLPYHAAFDKLGLIGREGEEIVMFGQRDFGVMSSEIVDRLVK
jgi:hypothetical protein